MVSDYVGMARYDAMRAAGNLPETNDPNWHLGKLRPWMRHQAVELGKQYKGQAERETDPFKKV